MIFGIITRVRMAAVVVLLRATCCFTTYTSCMSNRISRTAVYSDPVPATRTVEAVQVPLFDESPAFGYKSVDSGVYVFVLVILLPQRRNSTHLWTTYAAKEEADTATHQLRLTKQPSQTRPVV